MPLSGVFLSRTLPRLAGFALILAVLVVLQGCWVASINPLYDEGTWDHPHNDPDVVLDQSLIGSWSLTDKKCTTVLVIALEKRIRHAIDGAG